MGPTRPQRRPHARCSSRERGAHPTDLPATAPAASGVQARHRRPVGRGRWCDGSLDRLLGPRRRSGAGRRPRRRSKRHSPRRVGGRPPSRHLLGRASHHPQRTRRRPVLCPLVTGGACPLDPRGGRLGRPALRAVGRPLVRRDRGRLGGRLGGDAPHARNPGRAPRARRDRTPLARHRPRRRRLRPARARGGLRVGAARCPGHRRCLSARGRHVCPRRDPAGSQRRRAAPRRRGPGQPTLERGSVRVRGGPVAPQALPGCLRGAHQRDSPARLLPRSGARRSTLRRGCDARLVRRRGRLLRDPGRRRPRLQDRHRPRRAAIRPVTGRAPGGCRRPPAGPRIPGAPVPGPRRAARAREPRLPVRIDAGQPLRHRPASRLGERLDRRRRVGPRLQARPEDRRVRSRAARRPRRGRPGRARRGALPDRPAGSPARAAPRLEHAWRTAGTSSERRAGPRRPRACSRSIPADWRPRRDLRRAGGRPCLPPGPDPCGRSSGAGRRFRPPPQPPRSRSTASPACRPLGARHRSGCRA